MNGVAVRSWSDATPLYLSGGLWLVPSARVHAKITLPEEENASVSGWEACEKLREAARPLAFAHLKLVSSNGRKLRFEGEAEDRRRVRPLVKKLDGATLRLHAFKRPLKVEAFEPESEFPVRHTWDSFFRDAADMDEMKPGERPDTVHVAGLPVDWFKGDGEESLPSESVFRRAFERFGKIRRVDLPVCDPHRKQMKDHMTGITKFSFDSDLYFEGYVQFSEYVAFVRAMDAFRGMKLAKKNESGEGTAVPVRVDFDKTKHLSDASVKRRSIVRERLVARQNARRAQRERESLDRKEKREAERREKDRHEREKLTHTQEREQRRKAKQLAKLKEREASEINSKIAREKRKLLKTQRKLQSIRLIEELFKRIRFKRFGEARERESVPVNSAEVRGDHKKELKKIERALLSERQEKFTRDRLVSKYMNAQEQELEEQRKKLQKALDGKIVLRSVLDVGKRKNRSSSISSLSSGGSEEREISRKHVKAEKNTSPERTTLLKTDSGGVVPPVYSGSAQHYNYRSYGPYLSDFGYSLGNFHPRPGYFPQDHNYRGRGYPSRRSRANVYGARSFRHVPRMPYFSGPDANQEYYKYFKQLTEVSSGGYNRNRSYSRSKSRSRRRSYSRSRSRSSRSRSKSRSRSRSKSRCRSRSRSRRRSSSRYKSRYSKSRSYESRSRSRSHRRRSRSRSDKSRHSRRSTRSKSNDKKHSKRDLTRSKSKSRSQSNGKTDVSSRNKTSEGTTSATDFIPRIVRENIDKSKTSKLVGTAVEKDSVTSTSRERINSWSPVK